MNFLAHIFLSGDDPDVIIGNFMGDHIKGKQLNNYPDNVRAGILLHRAIDSFTDTNPTVALSKERLRPVFGKYAPVVSDVFYDHFLASMWEHYDSGPVKSFIEKFYHLARNTQVALPERTRNMLDHMIRQDWLSSYKSVDGIGDILLSMSRRTRFVSNLEQGRAELKRNYDLYRDEFRVFFPELQEFSENKLTELITGSNK